MGSVECVTDQVRISHSGGGGTKEASEEAVGYVVGERIVMVDGGVVDAISGRRAASARRQ